MSKNDGQFHYINAPTLMRLYKVDPHECLIRYNDKRDHGKDFPGLIELRPRYDGDYEIPQ